MLALLVEVLVLDLGRVQGNDDLGSARHLKFASTFAHRKMKLGAGSCQRLKFSLTQTRVDEGQGQELFLRDHASPVGHRVGYKGASFKEGRIRDF